MRANHGPFLVCACIFTVCCLPHCFFCANVECSLSAVSSFHYSSLPALPSLPHPLPSLQSLFLFPSCRSLVQSPPFLCFPFTSSLPRIASHHSPALPSPLTWCALMVHTYVFAYYLSDKHIWAQCPLICPSFGRVKKFTLRITGGALSGHRQHAVGSRKR